MLGSRVLAQRHIGVVGSGSFRTTWLDLDNRTFWMNVTCGYKEGEQVFRPAATPSPLVERSIRFTSHGEKNDFCGRLWDPSTGEYELTNWMAALARACQGFVEVSKQAAPTEEDVEVVGQRLASLTYEMSGHPVAREKLEALVNKYAYLFDEAQWKRISDQVRAGADRTVPSSSYSETPNGRDSFSHKSLTIARFVYSSDEPVQLKEQWKSLCSFTLNPKPYITSCRGLCRAFVRALMMVP